MADLNSTTGPKGVNPHSGGPAVLLPGPIPVETANYIDDRLRKARAITVIASATVGDLIGDGDNLDEEALMLSIDHLRRLLNQARQHLDDVDGDAKLSDPTLDRSGLWYSALIEAAGLVDLLWSNCWASGNVVFSGEILCDYLDTIQGAIELASGDLLTHSRHQTSTHRAVGVQ